MRKLLFFLLVLSALPLSRANAENKTVDKQWHKQWESYAMLKDGNHCYAGLRTPGIGNPDNELLLIALYHGQCDTPGLVIISCGDAFAGNGHGETTAGALRVDERDIFDLQYDISTAEDCLIFTASNLEAEGVFEDFKSGSAVRFKIDNQPYSADSSAIYIRYSLDGFAEALDRTTQMCQEATQTALGGKSDANGPNGQGSSKSQGFAEKQPAQQPGQPAQESVQTPAQQPSAPAPSALQSSTKSTSAPRLELGHGISIVLPDEWNVFSKQDMERLNEIAGEAMNNLGIKRTPGKENILFASYKNMMASVVISVIPSPRAKEIQDMLPALTASGLEKIDKMLYDKMRGTNRLIEAYPTRISTILGKNCMIFSYLLESYGKPAPAKTQMIQIPDEDRLIEIVTAYDLKYEAQALPVIEAALDSVRIDFAQKTDAQTPVRPGAPGWGADHVLNLVVRVATAIAIGFLLTFFLCRFTYRNFLPATVLLFLFSLGGLSTIFVIFQKSGWAVLAGMDNVINIDDTVEFFSAICIILAAAAGYFYGRKRYSNRISGPPSGPVQ